MGKPKARVQEDISLGLSVSPTTICKHSREFLQFINRETIFRQMENQNDSNERKKNNKTKTSEWICDKEKEKKNGLFLCISFKSDYTIATWNLI